MTYVIFKHAEAGDECERWYLTDIPKDDSPLGGYGYRGVKGDSVPDAAGTAPTEDDAKKICEFLRTAFYGAPEEHFYEKAPQEAAQ